MNWDDFLHDDTNSGKLRITLIVFWVVVVKNGHGTLISEWMDESSWFFACSYIFNKAKSYFNSYWVGMVKFGCALLGHGTV